VGEGMAIQVVVADDHQIMRAGLLSLLSGQSGIKVIGEAENGRRAVEMARELKPDVVVMDVSMPDLNGMEATRQLVGSDSTIAVIALSMHSDKRFVIGMLQAGASGYIVKDCASEELVNAIDTVAAGKKYLSPEIAGLVIDDCVSRSTGDGEKTLPQLSAREREVLQLVAEGWSTKDIAAHLYVSIKTIETHRRQIMKKLEIFNVADLTKYAIRQGFTSLH